MPTFTARRTPWIAAAIGAAVLAVAAACGGSGGQEGGAAQLAPEIVTTDLAVGPNSFSLALITEEQELILGAQVHARFFQVVGDQQVLRGEGDLEPVNITLSFVHEHADGTLHTHEAGELGVYKANVNFDQPGIWAAEVTATVDGKTYDPVTAAFEVREQSLSPAIGDPAPRSQQTILADVADITEIDTSDPPNPDMHNMTIADAVTSGKPTLIVFATPAFCVSRICGPTKQMVDDLYDKYKGQANFVHVEPYFLEEARQGLGLCPVPIFNLQFARDPFDPDCPRLAPNQLPPPSEDWRLETEPWVFVVDDEGNIGAKFEGVVATSEIESALQQVLTQ
ncbi:MAG: hypothetical protein ACE5IZ_11455 [Dehalococcoidia bacterium]